MTRTSPLLLAGRECGECTACCIVPEIEDEALTKPGGMVCPNCTGSGCAIYTARPKTCREFHCVWRYADPHLDEGWRPDRSGVLMLQEPAADGHRQALVMLVFAEHDVILDAGFATLVAIAVDRGADVILRLPVEEGGLQVQTTLNSFVAAGVASGLLPQVADGIRRGYASIWPLR